MFLISGSKNCQDHHFQTPVMLSLVPSTYISNLLLAQCHCSCFHLGRMVPMVNGNNVDQKGNFLILVVMLGFHQMNNFELMENCKMNIQQNMAELHELIFDFVENHYHAKGNFGLNHHSDDIYHFYNIHEFRYCDPSHKKYPQRKFW